MSFNFEKKGKPLCRVDGGQFDGEIIHLFIDGDDAPKYPFTFMNFDKDVKLQQVPNDTSEREILYITGASGSGKSTYTRKYCELYKKKYPKRPIFLFSSLEEDESLDSIKPMRFKIEDRLVSEPVKPEDIPESMVIFDDIDVIRDKKHRQAVLDLANQVLEIGRHYKISAIFTNHLPTNKGDTRRILNESHEVVFFPHSGTARGTRYLLESYVGIDNEMIKKIKKMPTRWCCVFKNYPQVVMTEHNIQLANVMQDEDD